MGKGYSQALDEEGSVGPVDNLEITKFHNQLNAALHNLRHKQQVRSPFRTLGNGHLNGDNWRISSTRRLIVMFIEELEMRRVMEEELTSADLIPSIAARSSALGPVFSILQLYFGPKFLRVADDELPGAILAFRRTIRVLFLLAGNKLESVAAKQCSLKKW